MLADRKPGAADSCAKLGRPPFQRLSGCLHGAGAIQQPQRHSRLLSEGQVSKSRRTAKSTPRRAASRQDLRAFFATRQASSRRSSGAAPCVKARNTSAVPGGLTTGKIAASIRRNVLTPFANWMRAPRCDLLLASSARPPGLALNFRNDFTGAYGAALPRRPATAPQIKSTTIAPTTAPTNPAPSPGRYHPSA